MSMHALGKVGVLAAAAATVLVGLIAPPAFAAVETEFQFVISASDSTFARFSTNCSTGGSGSYHYRTFAVDVPVAGPYSYYDIGFYDADSATIDSYVGIFTLGQFDPNAVTANCVGSRDDTGDFTFPSAGKYTMVVTTFSSDVTGLSDFRFTGPSALSVTTYAPNAGEKPTQIVQQVGMPATGTCDAIEDAQLKYGTELVGGWTPSYAEWPRDGMGGPVCTRTLYYDPNTEVWSILGMTVAAS
jgi:hypothetical protein